MQLYSLSDQELWENTRRLAEQERALTVKVLWHIREIERRRLHLERGYDSLHTYMVYELKYSSGSAGRRINAMALLKEIPTLEPKIKTGELTLSNLSQVGQFFKQEKKSGKAYSVEQKREVLDRVEGKSTRDCERVLVEISPMSAAVLKDRRRQVNAEQFEIKMIVTKKQMEGFERAKKIFQMIAKSGSSGWADVFEGMTEFYLDHKDEERKLKRGVEREQRKVAEKQGVVAAAATKAKPAMAVETKTTPASECRMTSTRENDCATPAAINALLEAAANASRYASAQTKRTVFKNAGTYQCSYTDSDTKRQCTATYGLQLDHRQPWARGGGTTPANLRYLCAAHNRLEAIHVFGPEKMQSYVRI